MKSPEYVYGVTKIYRRLLDADQDAARADLEELAGLFCRGGSFTDGYYTRKIDASMLGVRSETDKDASRRVRASFAPVRRAQIPDSAASVRKHEAFTPVLPPNPAGRAQTVQTARFLRAAQIPDSHPFSIVYLPLLEWIAHPTDRANGVVLPPVIYDRDREAVAAMLSQAKKGGIGHVLCGNAGHLALARQSGLTLHADFRCNICNRGSADFWFSQGAQDVLLSPELILPQIRDIGGNKAVIVYGRLPLMLLEKHVGADRLADRRGARFPILSEPDGLPSGRRDLVYNSVPIYMADAASALDAAGIFNRHFLFTTETPAQVLSILRAYQTGAPASFPIRRIPQKKQ